MADKTPCLLSPEHRTQFNCIPADLSDREMARHYTLTPAEIQEH